MAVNLRSRLLRIRQTARPSRSCDAPPESAPPRNAPAPDKVSDAAAAAAVPVSLSGMRSGLFPGSQWECVGYEVLGRRVLINVVPYCPVFPPAMSVLVRDLYCRGRPPCHEELVFFDLETTGLGGAGTLAFLASLGRFEPGGRKLSIEQFLLLDYPGESDFLEAVNAGISRLCPAGSPSLVVSYNGKTFDSQILKTRCLLNGITPPEYFHADILHPARRLWKRMLPDCSQGTIETEVLGLDRTGDIPGAMAPDIWFGFLKTGQAGELASICDHNIRDISGLASIFLLMGNIMAAPLQTLKTYCFDLETLALLWREAVRRDKNAGENAAGFLLAAAVERLMPRAMFALGVDLLKTGSRQGRDLLLRLGTEVPDAPPDLRALAFRGLALDAEWQSRDTALALSFTEAALSLGVIRESLKDELERRRERLLKKAKKWKQKSVSEK